MGAGLAEHVLAEVARVGDLLHSLLGAHVHDIERGAGEVRDHDRAMGGLLLRLPRPSEPVVVGGRVSGLDGLPDEHVDDGAVLGVHHHERAVLRALLERAQDLAVIREEDALVGHEELEARDAFLDELVHRGER